MPRLVALGPDSPIPVVSYARISADTKKDEHGVKDQHIVNHETAARCGWTVVHQFTDNDKSASKADVIRDGFEAMLVALRKGQLPGGTLIRGVVVVADDRLARRSGDYERFVDAFTYNDGFVFADSKSVKNLYSEDVESMGMFGVVISKMEARKIQRRMRRSHQARAMQGKPVGGVRPFGWKVDRLTLDPAEAPLIQKAAHDFIAGRSLNSIVTEWQKAGVLTPRGNPWRVQTLGTMLAAPRLCGWRRLNGDFVRDAEGNPVVGQWTPILTPEEWLAVQAIIDSRKGHQVGSDGAVSGPLSQDWREHTYLLTGFLRCGRLMPNGKICNKRLRASKPKGKEYHLYQCQSKGAGGCGAVSRRGDLVDFAISQLVLNFMEASAVFNAPEQDSSWGKEDELSAAMKRRDALTAKWESEEVSNEFFFSALPRLEKTISRLRAEKNRHAASVERQRASSAIDITELRRRWDLPEEEGGLALSQKRAHIREELLAVIVHPAGGGYKPFNPDLLEPVWRED
ncbi:recombinase family protein [Planobispora rosea]|uniref:recombinase family protein n=1 Tax=Planobispora rosea TaxID=35762 RepID=UPI0009FE0A8B|nr:recombinase family protein [Planobispora rosea]